MFVLSAGVAGVAGEEIRRSLHVAAAMTVATVVRRAADRLTPPPAIAVAAPVPHTGGREIAYPQSPWSADYSTKKEMHQLKCISFFDRVKKS